MVASKHSKPRESARKALPLPPHAPPAPGELYQEGAELARGYFAGLRTDPASVALQGYLDDCLTSDACAKGNDSVKHGSAIEGFGGTLQELLVKALAEPATLENEGTTREPERDAFFEGQTPAYIIDHCLCTLEDYNEQIEQAFAVAAGGEQYVDQEENPNEFRLFRVIQDLLASTECRLSIKAGLAVLARKLSSGGAG